LSPASYSKTEASMNTFLQSTPQRQADALSVIANPMPHHRHSLRLLAWAIMKASRGQTIHQHRLLAAQQADAPAGRRALPAEGR